MTTKSTLDGITDTANAKAVIQASGQDLVSLKTLADQHIVELKYLLGQMAVNYPQSGGDASNYTAMAGVISGLA